MARVGRADDVDLSLAADHLALLADPLDAGSNFHGGIQTLWRAEGVLPAAGCKSKKAQTGFGPKRDYSRGPWKFSSDPAGDGEIRQTLPCGLRLNSRSLIVCETRGAAEPDAGRLLQRLDERGVVGLLS